VLVGAPAAWPAKGEPETSVGAAIEQLNVLDPFATPEIPLSGDGRWTRLGFAVHPGHVDGLGEAGGWSPVGLFPAVNGAYWNPDAFDAGEGGAAVAATLSVTPLLEGRYFSLWLDMPDPQSPLRTGYELRFTQTAVAHAYDVTLSRWQNGAGAVLASAEAQSLPQQSSFALADEGDAVSAWTDTGSGFVQVLSAQDAALDAGHVGIAGAGQIVSVRQFRAGTLTRAEPPVGEPATLRASYRLDGDYRSSVRGAPPLVELEPGNRFAVETVGGSARRVLTFPRGGGLSLNTSGLVDSDSHSVAMLFRLDDVNGYRRILDFSGGTADAGLYVRDGRVILYPNGGPVAGPVIGDAYVRLVLTQAPAPNGRRRTIVYVDGAPVADRRTLSAFSLTSGVLRFFQDNTSGPATDEESGGAVACIQVYEGTLTPEEASRFPATRGPAHRRCQAPGRKGRVGP
jgi:hypothetical protein